MSKLINKTRLTKFATDFWAKIKGRYDVAFKNAEISPRDGTDKKITFTRISGTNPVDVSLQDYARLQDRNAFKKDVSVDDAKTVSNSNIGNINGPVPSGRRTTGYRGLTSKLFTDGYVKLLRVYLPENASGTINTHVWMIKKGDSKAEDRFLEPKINQPLQVLSSGGKKYVDVTIERTFETETFFVLRTEGEQQIKGVKNIKSDFIDDIINVDDNFNPRTPNENANWNNFNPNTEFVGYMELHGRTGIVDISKRLDELEGGNENFVKHTDCVAAGGTAGQAGKVVKLGNDGKLDNSLMPKIAINEYYSVSAFNNTELANVKYENGDVVVVTTNGQVSKRYLCINKRDGVANSTNDFIELNSKDGSVVSVNARSGAITLDLVSDSADNKLKLKIAGDGGNEVVKEIEMISEQDITEILDSLPQ